MADEQTGVLVVGGGLAGCAAAAFLATLGVDVVLLERHASPSIHPRTVGQSARTMELLRLGGVLDVVVAAGRGQGVGEPIDTSDISPAPPGRAPLDQLERILLAQAEKAGAGVRFSADVVDLRQDPAGVTCRVLDRWTERLSTVRADHVIAADGERSPIRERLGIRSTGPGALRHRIGVVFDIGAVFDAPERHAMTFDYHPERGESLLDFTADRVTSLVRDALGQPDLDVDVRSVCAWPVGVRVAERFRDRRVFLVGDAARVAPPNGTLGTDVTVADAYDIAWKLADVHRGAAGPGLLDTYDAERRPVAEQFTGGDLDPLTITFGLRCRSTAVLDDGPDDDLAEDPMTPTGRPGFRAPHVPLVRGDGDVLSTVDLFGDGWTLLTGAEGGVWHSAAERAARELGVRLDSCGLGPHLTDPGDRLRTRYGIGDSGASLVRPDGVVAWRCSYEVSDPAATLLAALRTLLGRTTTARAA